MSRLAQAPAWLHTLAFVLVASLAIGVQQWRFNKSEYPTDDALRYIDYAVNLYDHGVYGLSGRQRETIPEPGNANTPIYPAWLTLVMLASDDVARSLRCLVAEQRGARDCALALDTLWWLQAGLIVFIVLAVRVAARALFGAEAIAWIAAAALLLCGELTLYSNRAQTEIVFAVFFSWAAVALMLAWQRNDLRFLALCGALFSLSILTRPGGEYFVVVLIIALALAALALRRPRAAMAALVLFASTLAVLAPWSARNLVQLNSAKLTDGYAEAILAQRIAYNRMTWTEWGVAFVYYLPDFGDSLAQSLFDERNYERLGFHQPNSFYLFEARRVHLAALERAGGERKDVMKVLLRDEVLAHPVKHALVSVPLAIRALFPGKYWGLLGFACCIVTLVASLRRREYAFAVLAAPAFFMAAFYAGVSVSISRYNINLIPVYALAIAWCGHHLATRRRRGPGRDPQ